MSRHLKVLVADDELFMREYFQDLLPRLGHQVVAAEGGRQLVELCRATEPELVITDIRMPDLDGLVAAAEIGRDRPVPVIVVSAFHDSELQARAHQGNVMAYLVKPVKQADLESAIDLAMMRFEQFEALRREAASLRQALEDRKVIERAKGVVMKRLRMSEEEAFRRLRKVASDHNWKVLEVGQKVLKAEETFDALERAH